MKVLILTDDQYELILQSKLGPKLISPEGRELPSAEKLHEIARNGDEPPVFARVREELEAAQAAAEAKRQQMHDLIDAADRLGVRPVNLAAWSGYTPRRIHQITR